MNTKESKEKGLKIDRSNYLFDNKALTALIVPLVIEQLLAILVGMADSIMIANVGEAAVSGVSLVDQVMILDPPWSVRSDRSRRYGICQCLSTDRYSVGSIYCTV